MLPTLSTLGWATTLKDRADRLLSYFFLTNYSQSTTYRGKLASLPWVVANYTNDPIELRIKIEDILIQHMSPHFEDVAISVAVTLEDERVDNRKMDIKIDVIVIEDNQKHSLSHLIRSKDAKVNEIVDLINEGIKE
ncbi:hypothetical protein [Endozoicomonas sp. ONNA1]|uniref:hypothetical protein n=1 Tax=Endozoicomonas sp. ONNA1 TaxID=2828740 RepID=UPI0021485E4A|nr:hypothetical protein [Endozoicomonas sp. ONNA1]